MRLGRNRNPAVHEFVERVQQRRPTELDQRYDGPSQDREQRFLDKQGLLRSGVIPQGSRLHLKLHGRAEANLNGC